MGISKTAIEKIVLHLTETKQKINSLEFDVHWYRRVFHAFGSSFLLYYMLPNIDWINFLKIYILLIILGFAFVLEYLRIKGIIGSVHFFGMRLYEQKRVCSYLYFAIALVILLLFFPQQIAIPCILCACLADPIMGEIRFHRREIVVYIGGFLICMFFFLVTWYSADKWIWFFASIIGGVSAVIGETKKLWWIDDDFLIQILPAIILGVVWIYAQHYGFTLPSTIIYSGRMPW